MHRCQRLPDCQHPGDPPRSTTLTSRGVPGVARRRRRARSTENKGFSRISRRRVAGVRGDRPSL